MRTRKAPRRKKTKGTKQKGDTNPSSSNQVGGDITCEERQMKYCKKSCEKLCKNTRKLSKHDYENKLKAEKALLEAEILPLETEFKRLEKNAKDWHAARAHPLIRSKVGGFLDFLKRKPINPKCFENCEATCGKNKKIICDDIYKNTHETLLTRDIAELKVQRDMFKMAILNFNHIGFK